MTGTANADLSNLLTHTANTLTLGGNTQVSGTWGSTAPGCTATNKNATYFGSTAVGIITVNLASFYSIASGNWSTPGTWSLSSGGAALTSGFPVSNDIVYIEGGRNVTLTANATCASLNFTTATASSLTHAGFQLDVTGAITLPRTAVGSNTIAVGSGTLNAGSIAFTNAGVATGHQVTISTGTVKVTGSITENGTGNTSPNITFTGGGLLQIGSTIWSSADGTLTTVSGSTVEYNGTAQTVQAHTYSGNLKLSGSGIKTLQSGMTAIGGDLILRETATAATAVGLTISGNLDIGDGTVFTAAGFPLMVGGTTTVGAGTSGQLIISSSTGTPKRFTGLVTVATGGIWNNSGNSDVNFRGGITRSGTFTAGSGVLTFDNSSQQLTGTFTIPNVTVNDVGVVLTNNNTLTVATDLTGTGELTQAASATLNIGGTSGIATLNASNSGNTVNYNGTTNQIIKVPSSSQYANLSFNGTTSTGIATAVALSTIKISGNLVNNGVGVSGSFTGFNPSTSTVIFNGTSTLSGSTAFYNVTVEAVKSLLANSPLTSTNTFNNDGTFSSGTNTVTVKDLTNNSTGNFTAPTTILNIAGNLVNNSSNFIHNSGTANFNGGTSAQSISGTAPVTFNNITVSNTAGVTVSSPQNLYGILSFPSASIFNANGNLTLLSTSDTHAASIGDLSGVTFNGNVTVQRFMTNKGKVYRYVASPVSNPPLADLNNEFGNTMVQRYDETKIGVKNVGFVNVNTTANFKSGVGYTHKESTLANHFWDVTGPLTNGLSKGDVTWSLSYHNSGDINADGWNLLGNPYPSAIDWDGFTTSTPANILPLVYVPYYSGGTVLYRTWNWNQTGDLTNGIIALGQAFWVKTSVNNANLALHEAAKNTSGTFYRERNTSVPTLQVSVLREGVQDNAFLNVEPGTTAGYDQQFDAFKFDGNDLGISLLSKGGESLVYYATADPSAVDIELNVLADQIGIYTLKFEPIKGEGHFDNLYLVDRLIGVSKPLLDGQEYPFEVNHNASPNIRERFYISGKPFDEKTKEVRLSAYPNPTTGMLNIEVNSFTDTYSTVFNTENIKLGEVKLHSANGIARGSMDLTGAIAGLYFIKTYVNGKLIVTKLVKN